MSSNSPRAPNNDTEAARLHDALRALKVARADDPTRQEMHELRSDVIDASVALDRTDVAPRPRKTLPPAVARVVHRLNGEIFTVTTKADAVAAAIPEGQSHEDAVGIFEAGTRAAADIVRLEDVIDPSPR